MFWIWYEFKKNGKSESYDFVRQINRCFIGSGWTGFTGFYFLQGYSFVEAKLRLKQPETTVSHELLWNDIPFPKQYCLYETSGLNVTFKATARPTCKTLRSNTRTTRIPVFWLLFAFLQSNIAGWEMTTTIKKEGLATCHPFPLFLVYIVQKWFEPSTQIGGYHATERIE